MADTSSSSGQKSTGGDKPAVFWVRQKKSGIGRHRRQKLTLRAMGLGRIRRTVALPDTPASRGMAEKLQHLVEIVPKSE